MATRWRCFRRVSPECSRTASGVLAAMENQEKKIAALQFHPEVTHTENGMQCLRDFISRSSARTGTWVACWSRWSASGAKWACSGTCFARFRVASIRRLRRRSFIARSATGFIACSWTTDFFASPLDNLGQYDAVVIVTNHSIYDYKAIVEESQLVVDTRNATKGIISEKIVRC